MPRDPYKRVDILASSRQVRVEIDGVTVAESDQPRISVRDRAAAALLPAAERPADGPAAAVGHEHALPVQGHGELLVGRHRHPGAQGRGLDLPDAVAREPEGRRARLLLQRAGRHRTSTASALPRPKSPFLPSQCSAGRGVLRVAQYPQDVAAGELAAVVGAPAAVEQLGEQQPGSRTRRSSPTGRLAGLRRSRRRSRRGRCRRRS